MLGMSKLNRDFLYPSIDASSRRRNYAMLLYIVLSFGVAMSISQEETPEIYSFRYWLLIVPSILLPLTDVSGVVRALLGRARPILIFGLTAGFWQLLRGDTKAALQLVLIVLVLGWLCSRRARIEVRDLIILYLTLILVGICVWIFSDYNKWGMLPNTTVYDGLDWRISFFPNIANSAILSLVMFLILTQSIDLARKHIVVLLIVAYFLFFSFVRTATIGVLLYITMHWWLSRKPRSSRSMFWTSFLLGIGINLMIAGSAIIFANLGGFELISRLFLRSETNLSSDEVFAQLYRPWLWVQHLLIFWDSPLKMGFGAFDFSKMQFEELNIGTTPAGNEAQLTRLLATYGLPGLLYSWFLICRLHEASLNRDVWAVACFPVILLLMMQWGNIFHPSDANGAIFWLIAIHGSNAFINVKKQK
jgi:hypothetical protein